MRNSISEFFLLELEGWTESLGFYLEEIKRSSEWLSSILKLNTVPGLSMKVEHYLQEYDRISGEINALSGKMKELISRLSGEDMYPPDGPIEEAFVIGQKEMRMKMQKLEKKYLELKYECDEFVAGTLAVQH